MTQPTVTLIGAGGVAWTMDLPLSSVYVQQVRDGKLRPATSADSQAVLAQLAGVEVSDAEPDE